MSNDTKKKKGKKKLLANEMFLYLSFSRLSSWGVQGMNMSLTEIHSTSSAAVIPWAHVWLSEWHSPSQILKRSRHQMLERPDEAARMTTTILLVRWWANWTGSARCLFTRVSPPLPCWSKGQLGGCHSQTAVWMKCDYLFRMLKGVNKLW